MIRIDHLGVPARARLDAASFVAGVFGLDGGVSDDGRFTQLRMNSEFAVDFFESEQIDPMHVAFVVDNATFTDIVRRLKSKGISYGSQPDEPSNARLDHPLAERGLYFLTPDGHLIEVMASPLTKGRR
jgi:catechol 2,3-dioxygenase-like lactoylglutathione lyase family enzyme